jgi:2-keto-3-deoxy-galactonokinase
MPILIGLPILLMIWGLATDKTVKDSPEQIGFVIGGMVGLIWVFWAHLDAGGRGAGTANYFIIVICGSIGSGIGWLVSRFLILH